MINNIKILRTSESNNWFKRNYSQKINLKKKINFESAAIKIVNFFARTHNLNFKSILEIGCSTGIKLNQYKRIFNSKINYGIDLSNEAIKFGRKKYKKLKLKRLSSLEINKINNKFDLIICGFYLYLLDRDEIFNQFNLIYKKLNPNGYLIIEDFDPIFKHTNKSLHNSDLKSFKMSYQNFLEESGVFKLVFKHRLPLNKLRNEVINDKFKFKSTDASVAIYKKIDFIASYPENL
jgi:cyclopropane fatty-acyl-phospholipid synthase-like methyltransferase